MKKLALLLYLFSIFSISCSKNLENSSFEKTRTRSWLKPISNKFEAFFSLCGLISDENTVYTQQIPAKVRYTKKELERKLCDVRYKISNHSTHIMDLQNSIAHSNEAQAVNQLCDCLYRLIDDKVKLQLALESAYRKKTKQDLIKQIQTTEQLIVEIQQSVNEANEKRLNLTEYKELLWRTKKIEHLKEKVQQILTLLEEYND